GSGQTWVCANRIYVHSTVYAEFASRLADEVAAFKIGDGLDESTTHGPLIHSRATEKVTRHIEDAVSKGAQVLVGGKEKFGPLAALFKFDTEDEVIKLANATEVGLSGYLFSRDIGRAWRVAERLEVGMVAVNTGLISQAVIPFGGVKECGIGRGWSTWD
ncbi:Aldehyde/histidinol dehydrogenase, partial [Lentinula edodes]